MITNAEYMQIVSEVCDLSDYKTQKEILFCNEAKRIVNIENIVNRLYNHIRDKITDIDFGTIPRSKGNITKIENYTEMIDCISSIHDLAVAYREDTKIIDQLSTAVNNIQQRERLFSKSFALNIELPIMVYNMTVLSIVSATSLLISSSVEFIKNGKDSFQASFDKVGYKKSRNHVMHQYLEQFNRNCDNGSIDKLINECIKNNLVATNESDESLQEGIGDIIGSETIIKGATSIAGLTALGANVGKEIILVKNAINWAKGGNKIVRTVSLIIAAGAGIVILLNLIRWAISFFLHSMMKASDWFELQSYYLQINAENLKYRDSGMDEERVKNIYQKQVKWAEAFKKASIKLDVLNMKAQAAAKKDDGDYRDQNDNEDDSYDDGGLF